jgi:small subunit ribosomal protein S7
MTRPNYYKKIINLLSRSGQKQTSSKLFGFCFTFIKLFFKANPSFVFKKALYSVVPSFELKRVQRGSQLSFAVRLTTLQRRQSMALRWFTSIAKTNNTKLSKQLALELFNASQNKGKSFEKKVDLLKKAEIFKNS